MNLHGRRSGRGIRDGGGSYGLNQSSIAYVNDGGCQQISAEVGRCQQKLAAVAAAAVGFPTRLSG
jgi:hypothetical protein